MRIPVGVFTSGLHPDLGYLIGAFFTGNTREIDFVLHSTLVHHDHVDQVFIDGSVQVLETKRTEEIYSLSFLEIKLGMLDAGIIPDFGMQEQ
jgi:hypothetical protein